jgi:hypothetical protein
MTYHFKIYGHNDIIQYKVMLRQEMESYPIIILAWAHNKDDNKVISVNVVGRLSTNLHAVANGGHGFSLKLEHLNQVNTWRPCITFRNFL